jgi:hypothetical protein
MMDGSDRKPGFQSPFKGTEGTDQNAESGRDLEPPETGVHFLPNLSEAHPRIELYEGALFELRLIVSPGT